MTVTMTVTVTKKKVQCLSLNVNTGFSYFGPKLNNVIPKDIKNSKSTDDFTTNLKGWISKNIH